MLNDPRRGFFFVFSFLSFFWEGAPSGSGGYPNRSYETVSIGIRAGAVRRPRGWNRCAEGPEAYLQITSFMRVGGRISHSSHLSGPNPATWARDRRRGAGLTRPVRTGSPRWSGTCCCLHALPLVSHFLFYVFFFFL